MSIYKLNEEDFDSDDAYSEDADDDSCSVCSSDSEGSVDSFAAQARFDSEYDVDSRARRLRHRRLVARLATRGCPEFVAAGTKIVGLDSGSFYYRDAAVNFIFDARTRLVSATPPLRSPKKYDTFWAIGGTVYALDTSRTQLWKGALLLREARTRAAAPLRDLAVGGSPPAAVQDGPHRRVPRRAPGRRHGLPVRVQDRDVLLRRRAPGVGAPRRLGPAVRWRGALRPRPGRVGRPVLAAQGATRRVPGGGRPP